MKRDACGQFVGFIERRDVVVNDHIGTTQTFR